MNVLVALFRVMLVTTFLSSLAVFLAEGEGMSSTTAEMGALVAGFTAMVGLMVWVVRKLLDQTIPNMQKTFNEIMERRIQVIQEVRDEFAKGLATVTAAHRLDLEETIKAFVLETSAQRELFEKKLNHERDFFAKQLEALINDSRQTLVQLTHLIEVQATDIKDLLKEKCVTDLPLAPPEKAKGTP